MAERKPPAPAAADPRPGKNKGYAEPQPRDRDDARQPMHRRPEQKGEKGDPRAPRDGEDASLRAGAAASTDSDSGTDAG